MPWGWILPEAGLREALEAGVAEGAAPAAVLLLWRGGRVACELAAGRAAPDTVFDLASLTKPLASAALAWELREAGALDWQAPLGELLGPALPADKADLTVRHLLCHSAGLPPHRPYYTALMEQPAPMRRGLLQAMLLNEPLERPPGAAAIYSDLGYLLLGLILERAACRTMDAAIAELYASWGVRGPCYLPLGQDPPWPLPRIAPCGPLPGRPVIHGQVEDENAFALGGVAGHAGLFGSARQVAAVMDALCRQPGVVEMFEVDAATPGSARTPGFDTPSGPDSAAGPGAPAGVVGHLGFTGTSVWWRPADNTGAVLLTNRVAYGRDNERIHGFRRRMHGLAWAELGYAP